MKAASQRPLTTVIEQALLAPHTRAVLSKGLGALLDGASSTFQDISEARAHMKPSGVVDSQRHAGPAMPVEPFSAGGCSR